jgi:RNA exonuclease 1
MGTAASGDSELIRVTLIDYFSAEVLVNNIVQPDVPMQHLNTRFSGVSWADVRQAKKQGNCLRGTAGARKALWKYVGPDTIVVGHGASNDLRALRWIHELVVDSFVTEFGCLKGKEVENKDEKIVKAKEERQATDRITDLMKEDLLPGDDRPEGTPAVDMFGKISDRDEHGKAENPQKKKSSGPGNLSLKTLVKKRLGRDIQMGGRRGHDSLEDAIAARDLVNWIIENPK